MEYNFETKTKTCTVYSSDENFIKNKGIKYKEVIRLGVQALDNNWSLAKDTKQVDDLKNRISFMSKTLQNYIDKTDILVRFIKQEHKIGINLDELTNDEVRKKLEEME